MRAKRNNHAIKRSDIHWHIKGAADTRRRVQIFLSFFREAVHINTYQPANPRMRTVLSPQLYYSPHRRDKESEHQPTETRAPLPLFVA